jgi:hypothetical protein
MDNEQLELREPEEAEGEAVTLEREDATAGLNYLRTYFARNALVAINVEVARSRVLPDELPPLEERMFTGYRPKGAREHESFQFLAAGFICGPPHRQRQHWAEWHTAYDYILMRRAARAAGINLYALVAWRSMEAQQREYARRRTPADVRRLGAAAPPGRSNHQAGLSIDVHTGIGDAERFAAGVRTDTFRWLEANCERFGFVRDVPSEPWHFTHKGDRLYGTAEPIQWVEQIVGPDGTELARHAIASAQSNIEEQLNKDVYDQTYAFERASRMQLQTRQELATHAAGAALEQHAHVNTSVAHYQTSRDSVRIQPQGFDATSIQPLVFNFTQGVWGDGEIV